MCLWLDGFRSRPMCFGCAQATTFRPELYKGTKILINLIKNYENDSVLNMDFHIGDIRLHLGTHILQTTFRPPFFLQCVYSTAVSKYACVPVVSIYELPSMSDVAISKAGK